MVSAIKVVTLRASVAEAKLIEEKLKSDDAEKKATMMIKLKADSSYSISSASE